MQVVYDEADEDVEVEDPFAVGVGGDDTDASEGWQTDEDGVDQTEDEEEDDDADE